MPVNPIVIDTSIEAVAIVEPSWGNLLILGRDTGGAAPDDTVEEFTDLASVGTRFGSTSDIYYAAKKAFEQNVYKLWCMRMSTTQVAAEVLTSGSAQVLANLPVTNRPLPVVAANTFEYTAGVPTDPGVNKIMLNTNTGAYWLNAGAGPMQYDYIDWDVIEAAVSNADISEDIVVLANVDMMMDNFGDLTQFLAKADANNWVTVYMSEQPWSAQTAAEIVIEVARYSSRNVMPVGHKNDTANDDIAAAAAGLMSVTEPWDKMMWKKILQLTMASTDFHNTTEVETTLEGGNCNALINKQNGTRLSDGLTSVGGTDYKYVDISRFRYYLEAMLQLELSRTIANTKIPYSASGIDILKSVIEVVCQTLVNEGAIREPFMNDDNVYTIGYSVQMPRFADVSSADRNNRVLNGVYVTVYYRGHIQEISLNLAIQL